METSAGTSLCRHSTINLTSEYAPQFIDLTDRVQAAVRTSTIQDGVVNIHTRHTTAAIVVQEDEPLLLEDLAAMLERIAPVRASYRHDDLTARTVNLVPNERANGHAHCRALLLNTTACLNVSDGRLVLGRWQRIFLVELDGPRPRQISLLVIGEASL